MFRLIFSTSPEQQDEIGVGDGIPEAFRMLRENAALLAPPGASCHDVHLVALGAWAQVHGLAVLMLDGQIPSDERLVDALIAAVGLPPPDANMGSLAAQPPPKRPLSGSSTHR